MTPLVLVDLGAEFWRTWGAVKSEIDAYSQTFDRVHAYAQSYPTIVCLDGGNTRRRAMCADYKANRPKRPDEAYAALDNIEAACVRSGIPTAKVTGYEADDVIAALVSQAGDYDAVWIHTRDKDLAQLCSDRVLMLDSKGEWAGESWVREKWGLAPAQIRDLLALAGDTSDNVQGCPGVGLGKATTLLQTWPTIGEIKAAGAAEWRKLRGFGEKVCASLESWDPTLAVRLVTLDPPPDIRLPAVLAGCDW